jgi:hypothetical protein
MITSLASHCVKSPVTLASATNPLQPQHLISQTHRDLESLHPYQVGAYLVDTTFRTRLIFEVPFLVHERSKLLLKICLHSKFLEY